MVELTENYTAKEMRIRILKLAWPAVLRMFLQSVVGIVDVMMIGSLGAAALAAVDMSNRLMFVLIGALTALTIGSTALVARYTGAKNQEKANQVIVQSIVSGIILSTLLAVLGIIFAEDLLRLMMILMEEVDNFVLRNGSVYLKIVFASMIFGLPLMIINALLQGIGDMKTPLYIMVVTNIINTVCNYLLIFGIGFFPELGVAGAAIGTALGRVVGALIGFGVLIHGKSGIKIDLAKVKFKLDLKVIKDIFIIGIPASIEQLIRQGSQIVYTLLIAGLGTITVAANAIIMNGQMIPIMIGFGFSMAATTLVGQSLGAQKEELAKEYGKQTAYLTMIIMGVISIPMFIWTTPIIKLFSDNLSVVSIAKPAMKISILMQPVFAILMVISGALRGAGDTKWTMYITAIGNWGVRMVLSLLLGYYLGYGLIGFWIAMVIDIGVRTVLIMWRYSSDKWQEIQGNREKTKLVA
ncbi:MATE family efflux transporter [Orenia marismortui]|uniref:Probable multidrug resistance protein NorM n=1 Tax=Orenia marismortui TaxID=46469 RepID=A0A4R8GRC2_9FIRM|nr:MATE family efflux transporter [Orenia marismortui]TDX48409.1 putative MATE family efflux protein [Orenia marismortui]